MIQQIDTPEALDDPWFVIWAESRAEKKIAQRLEAIGIESWLPVVRERHRWSDRWRDVECPLFPGYLFGRVINANWQSILRTPGVLTVVKQGKTPALLADSFVTGLRNAIERNGAMIEPVTELTTYTPGDEVVVQEGVLHGLRGVVREHKGRRQLLIWVAEIGNGIAFTIGAARVKSASDSNSLGVQATACGGS